MSTEQMPSGLGLRLPQRQHDDLVTRIDQERCILCGLCVAFCPEQAVSMKDAVVIHPNRCTGCALCVPQCPTEALSVAPRTSPFTRNTGT